jgi:3' terminal RNA ribose 2'-O-methyltransferase Hen1
LADSDDAPEDALDRDPIDEEPTTEDTPHVPLNERRIQTVLETLQAEDARRVIDLGCGAGKLLGRLMQEPSFTKVTGMDVSYRAIALADRRLRRDQLPAAQAERLDLFQGALTYTDARFHGFDAAVLMEVIEHLDPPRLPALERVVFGDAKPRVVIVTTPNVEYNVRYEGLTGHRHSDHRFEWTRAQFQDWASRAAEAFGYQVRYVPVGDDDPEVGAPTQMGVFTR